MMTDLASTTPQSLGRDPMVGLRLARVDGFEPAIALGQDELPAYLRRFTMLFADDATMRRGGIGRVTRAINAQGEAVALKQLILPTRDEFDDDATHEALVAKFEAAFREEYECHRALSGLKGFPRLYGWGEVDGVPAIVMEWVEGETLARLRSRLAVDDAGRLSPLVAARLGRDLFDLLCRMSLVGEGFVHRDISPANIMVRTAHLSHIELCGLVLSSRPLADGRSPQSRAADRSWVSRFIVRAPVGTLQHRYFAEYGTSAARIMSQLALRQRNPMDSTAVINMVCGPAGEPMVRALEECHQDTNLYRNALDRLSQAAELMPAERAEAVLVLFVAVGCSADVRSSVNYAIDYAHATCGGGTSTPRSLGMSMTAGEREPAPAHPLGLLRVQNSFVVSAPRWIQPSEQGVEIGALATGEGDITDVGDDVSARHAHIWCDAQNIWRVEDLSSTNGTVVVNGATRVCIQVEPGRSAQLNPGDELKLGESTTYAILFGAL